MRLNIEWVMEKIKNLIFRLRYPYVHHRLKRIKIKSIEETITKIISDGASISRFGDGEMMWLLNVKHGSFQNVSDELSKQLKRVLGSSSDIMVGLPDAFKSVSQFKYRSGRIWRTELSKYGLKFYKVLDDDKEYFNANISRMYIDYKDYTRSGRLFDLLKKIWNGRNLLIVEGETSRLGVGNDLFNGSLSIQRIVCPSRNAFESYSDILTITEKEANKIEDPLILLALGPTATVLAFDIHEKGFQVLDIGHVDVEYEWYRMHAKHKVSLKYKDVSEVNGNNPQVKLDDVQYKREIIARVG
ncbi:SP_1767 family glycosyltransferase [Lactobacillus sp. PFC-70]|nr:SP_1767 family glycosyltransferase [Lactobacillus sp. PFC-70]